MIFQPSTQLIKDGTIITMEELDKYVKKSDMADFETGINDIWIAINGKAGSNHTHSMSDVGQLEQYLIFIYKINLYLQNKSLFTI